MEMKKKTESMARSVSISHESAGGFYLRKAIHDKINTELYELSQLKTRLKNRGYIS